MHMRELLYFRYVLFSITSTKEEKHEQKRTVVTATI